MATTHDSKHVPKGWEKLPEFPLPSEVMGPRDTPVLMRTVKGASEPKQAYLHDHYKVMRYEATEPMRLAIQQFKGRTIASGSNQAFVHTKVFLQGYTFTPLAATARLSFVMDSPLDDRSGQSERLIPDTLVALSSDDFQSECLIATVADGVVGGNPQPDRIKDGVLHHTIELRWALCEDAIFDTGKEMTMIEAANGYFESIRHILLGLQRVSSFRTAFDECIMSGAIVDKQINRAAQLHHRQPSLEPGKLLDASQMKAFQRIMTRELAVVQGPPGTGKTFTSVASLQSLVVATQGSLAHLSERVPPIIVAAQTNHALDQLLQICLQQQIGIIARLGGRSSNDSISQRTVQRICRKSKHKMQPDPEERTRKETVNRFKDLLEVVFPTRLVSAGDLYISGLLTFDQHQSLTQPVEDWERSSAICDPIEAWLGITDEEPKTFGHYPKSSSTQWDSETSSEEDSYCPNGEFIPVNTNRISGLRAYRPSDDSDNKIWQHQAEHYLKTTTNLYDVKPPIRRIIYWYLEKKLVQRGTRDIRELLQSHEQCTRRLKINRHGHEAKVLSNEEVNIIGCTTTGLTKYWHLLYALGPRILMIEEAAETREANIVSGLFPTLEQLILIGDHQQLMPQVDTQVLASAPYNLHVSLFERLVNLGLPYSTLNVQRRMRPEIRQVINALYPDLVDHHTVDQLPSVPGMKFNLWWFKHDQPESKASVSFSNNTEAEMIVGLVWHLIATGTDPRKITILSYYSGQIKLIDSKLRECRRLGKVHPSRELSVSTIDGFQGEENDIILLSLVRSPRSIRSTSVGFVSSENRATVALSRARRGLYIFGNATNLLKADFKSKQTWQKVYNVFADKNRTSYYLPITCKAHGTVTNINKPSDWHKAAVDGCDKLCVNTRGTSDAYHQMDHKPGKEHDQRQASPSTSPQRAVILQTKHTLMIENEGRCDSSQGLGGHSAPTTLPERKPAPTTAMPQARLVRTSDSLMNDGYFHVVSQGSGRQARHVGDSQATGQTSCGLLIDLDIDAELERQTLDDELNNPDMVNLID